MVTIPLRRAIPALLERAVGRAVIAELETARLAATDPAERARLSEALVARSREHRVMTSQTAFLVLETEWDYQRYCLGRGALGDILVVRSGALQVVDGSSQGGPPWIGCEAPMRDELSATAHAVDDELPAVWKRQTTGALEPDVGQGASATIGWNAT